MLSRILVIARRAFAAAAVMLVQSAFAAEPLLSDDSPAEGAWFDPATSGQGMLLDAVPGANLIFAAWFTFEPGDEPGRQRWFTAQLRANGSIASGPLHVTSGGRFNQPPGAQQRTTEVGTLTLDFVDCSTARVSYSIVDPTRTETGQFTVRAGAALVDRTYTCSVRTKLRWPHAAPTLTAAQYQALADRVFIPNNYAVHQGGVQERPDDLYLHSGIDIVTNQGDPIYALEDGVVRSVRTAGTNSGFTVAVESTATPKRGWGYVHILPAVDVGTRVTAGQRIGTVQFPGLPHLHLSRVRQPEGVAGWELHQLVNEDPTAFFDIPDAEAPRLRAKLIFMRNGTDAPFAVGAPVSGDVDIVAGIADPGPHSRFDFGGSVLGDRHNVAWIEYEIAGQGAFVHRRAFDFLHLGLTSPTGDPWSMAPLARIVVVPILRVPVEAAERVFNYYRVTNGSGGDRIELADGDRAWNTAARNADGSRAFPDGRYAVTVRAADWAGNIAQVQDAVDVDND